MRRAASRPFGDSIAWGALFPDRERFLFDKYRSISFSLYFHYQHGQHFINEPEMN